MNTEKKPSYYFMQNMLYEAHKKIVANNEDNTPCDITDGLYKIANYIRNNHNEAAASFNTPKGSLISSKNKDDWQTYCQFISNHPSLFKYLLLYFLINIIAYLGLLSIMLIFLFK